MAGQIPDRVRNSGQFSFPNDLVFFRDRPSKFATVPKNLERMVTLTVTAAMEDEDIRWLHAGLSAVKLTRLGLQRYGNHNAPMRPFSLVFLIYKTYLIILRFYCNACDIFHNVDWYRKLISNNNKSLVASITLLPPGE